MNDDSPGRIGVYSAMPGLRLLQPYTQDPALVRAAAGVSAAGTVREDSEKERLTQISQRLQASST